MPTTMSGVCAHYPTRVGRSARQRVHLLIAPLARRPEPSPAASRTRPPKDAMASTSAAHRGAKGPLNVSGQGGKHSEPSTTR